MRIENMLIKNFRLYKGVYNFDFSGKDLIVVHGPNGNGKSCLFDAIEWCLTGEISRYQGRERQKFNYLIHQGALEENDDMYVELDLGDFRVKRREYYRRDLKVKEIYINKKKVQSLSRGNNQIREYLSRSGETEIINNENVFKEQFTATQILSQDKLTEFVHSTKPQDRFNVMEKILGLKRYGVDFREHIKSKIVEQNENLEELTKDLNQIDSLLNQKSTDLKVLKAEIKNEKEQIEKKGYRDKGTITSELNTLLLKYDLSIKEDLIDTSDIFSKCRVIISKQIGIFKQQVKLLESVYDQFEVPISEHIKTKEKLDCELKDYESEKVQLEKSIESQQNEVEEEKKVDFLYKQYSEKRNEISVLSKKIISQKKNVSNVESLILDRISDEFTQIKDFESKYKDFENLSEDIKISKLILSLQKKVEVSTDKADRIKKEINNTSKAIELKQSHYKKNERLLTEITTGNSKTILEKNLELYEQVRNSFGKDEELDVCLICGSPFADHESLISALREQEKALVAAIDSNTQTIVKTGVELKEIEQELIQLRKKFEQLNKDFDSHVEENSSNNTEILVLNGKLSDDIEPNSIINQESMVTNFIEKYRDIYGTLKLLDKDYRTIEELELKVKKLNNLAKELQNKVGKEIDLDSKSQFSTVIESMKMEVDEKRNSLKSLTLRIEQIRKNKVEVELKIDSIEKSIDKVKGIIPSFSGSLSEITFNLEKFRDEIEHHLEVETNLSELIREYNSVLSYEKLSDLERKKLVLDKEENSYNAKISLINENIKNVENLIEDYENVIDLSQNTHSVLMHEFISNYNKTINDLYTQITPHNYNKHVNLIVRDSNLYLILDDGRSFEYLNEDINDIELIKLSNASLTLSSAQSSILAVCVFIAMNMSQNWTNLSFIGIDDPFQNMDDINVFSFVDVMSNVFGKKQTMISSHNDKFAQLISLKSELDESKVAIINLESYSKNKVKIISEIVEKVE